MKLTQVVGETTFVSYHLTLYRERVTLDLCGDDHGLSHLVSKLGLKPPDQSVSLRGAKCFVGAKLFQLDLFLP